MGKGKFLGLEEQVHEDIKEEDPEEEDYHHDMFIEGVTFMLRTHMTARDSLVFEYTTVWSRVKYLFTSLSQTDFSNKPVSFFEHNFKNQFETLNSLAQQVKNYYDIFNAFYDTIAQAVHLVDTSDTISREKKGHFLDLIGEVYMSLKPLPGSHFFSLYFGTEWELFQVIQSEVSQYMEQEGGTTAKYSHILKKSPNPAKGAHIETPRVPQPLGIKPNEAKNYWTKPNEQRREGGEFTQQSLKQIPNSKYEIPIPRQFSDPNAPSRGWGDGNEIDQIIIANYELGGNPPDIILGSGR